MTEAIATTVPQVGGRARVHLEGVFPHPHWLAFLCGGLSAAGVAVVSGQAVKPSPLAWEAHLVLDGDASDLDLVALANTRPPVRDAAPPVLSSWRAERRTDGLVELTVEAPDALGFLGRLLRRISVLTLLPTEVEIATVDGRISDRFVLSGIGSAPPSDDVLAALRSLLAGMSSA